MAFPIPPPVEPMLARASEELPGGGGWLYEPKWDGFRTLVFRDGADAAPPVPRAEAARSLLPGARRPAARAAAPALRGRRRAGRGRAEAGSTSTPSSFASTRRSPGSGCSPREQPGQRGAVRPPGARRSRPPRSAVAERRALLEEALAQARRAASTSPRPPAIAAAAADWFRGSRGRGSTGWWPSGSTATYQPGVRAMVKVKHARTADCAVAGFRWHKNGPGTMVGSLLLGLHDDGGHAPPRRASAARFTTARRRELVPELAPLREGAMRGPPVARLGASGQDGDDPDRRLPGRDEPLEPRQGSLLGAAARRAGLRGGLRPPAGRSLPPRHPLRPLAAGPLAARSAATTQLEVTPPYELSRIFGGECPRSHPS